MLLLQMTRNVSLVSSNNDGSGLAERNGIVTVEQYLLKKIVDDENWSDFVIIKKKDSANDSPMNEHKNSHYIHPSRRVFDITRLYRTVVFALVIKS